MCLDFTAGGLQFGADFAREFLRERAQIERDYAARLEQLCKRFGSERQRQRAHLLLLSGSGSGSSSLGSAEKPNGGNNENGPTLLRAWLSLLDGTEEWAHTRHQWAEHVQQQLAERLKTTHQRQEEARRRHQQHALKLAEERQRAYADKDKAKQLYDQQCDTVEAAKNRYERAPATDDKSQEKASAPYPPDSYEYTLAAYRDTKIL